jgi:N6-adenosine-specific RNA methylase IME4
MTLYRTIVADPPWPMPSGGGWNGKAGRWAPYNGGRTALPYTTMTPDEIRGLPVSGMADADAHLYLWTVNHHLETAFGIARAWDFEPRTLLTWAKTPMGLGPGGAFSQTTEHILFCRRGADVRKARADSTWWNWKRGQHSAKPEAFLDLVETVSPGPYVELFARRDRLGWDTWGDESLGTSRPAFDDEGCKKPGEASG